MVTNPNPHMIAALKLLGHDVAMTAAATFAAACAVDALVSLIRQHRATRRTP